MISPKAVAFQELTQSAINKVDIQTTTEMYYNKKTVRSRILQEMERDKELMECFNDAVESIITWATTFNKYESKVNRLRLLLENNEIEDIVRSGQAMVMALDDRSDLLTSLAGQLAGVIQGLDTHKDQVVTAGEILTLMCDANLFDMEPRDKEVVDEETGEEYITTSWYITNPWELSKELSLHINRAMYLPPLIVTPRKLTNNRSTCYITKEPESLILGKGNHHDGDICLDSLNQFSSIPLALNEDMLRNITHTMLVDKDMQDKLDSDPKRREQHDKFIKDSYHIYAYLIKNGNKFWLEYKTDKRGRTYSQGYHCNVQGNAFRKSIIEFAGKEVINGSFYTC